MTEELIEEIFAAQMLYPNNIENKILTCNTLEKRLQLLKDGFILNIVVPFTTEENLVNFIKKIPQVICPWWGIVKVIHINTDTLNRQWDELVKFYTEMGDVNTFLLWLIEKSIIFGSLHSEEGGQHIQIRYEIFNKTDTPFAYIFISTKKMMGMNDIELMFNVAQEKLKKQIKPRKNRTPLDHRLRHEVFKRDGFKCKECGAMNSTTTLHVDHILPVSQGGTDELDNLQTLCESCNLAKSNKFFRGGIDG